MNEICNVVYLDGLQAKVNAPSAFGTSPKYDDSKFESFCKYFIVVFGGGRVGAVLNSKEKTMTETNVLPWVEVNEMMDDEYRQLVVAEALGHYPKASPELNKFALDVFKKTIQVNGFRSFQSIPLPMAKIQVVKEFRNNEHVAEAVICLWAEKQHELIESLAKAARESNIPVPETWGWQQARHGFVQGEDTPEFDKLATDLSAQKSKPESDHYLLAALWLSHSLYEK